VSGWRLAVKTLYGLGGRATTPQIETRLPTMSSLHRGLWVALNLGLVEHGEWRNRDPIPWTLTELGRHWCEGRVVERQAARRAGQRGESMRFVATWLMALPRGLAIGARSCQCGAVSARSPDADPSP
jgi:hypothetical protein